MFALHTVNLLTAGRLSNYFTQVREAILHNNITKVKGKNKVCKTTLKTVFFL